MSKRVIQVHTLDGVRKSFVATAGTTAQDILFEACGAVGLHDRDERHDVGMSGGGEGRIHHHLHGFGLYEVRLIDGRVSQHSPLVIITIITSNYNHIHPNPNATRLHANLITLNSSPARWLRRGLS